METLTKFIEWLLNTMDSGFAGWMAGVCIILIILAAIIGLLAAVSDWVENKLWPDQEKNNKEKTQQE
jgi:hypothetical protein